MGRRLLAAASLVLALCVAMPPAAPATSSVQCQIVDFAPAVARSHHALCVNVVRAPAAVPGQPQAEHIEVRTSSNDGKTWTTRKASGLVETPDICAPPPPSPASVCQWGTHLSSAFHSTGWGVRDRTLYIGLRDAGLFSSTDDGETWTLAAVAGSRSPFGGYFQPFHDTRSTPVSETGSDPVAYVNNGAIWFSIGEPAPPSLHYSYHLVDGPQRIDPPLARPVPGTGEDFEVSYLFHQLPHGADPGLGLGVTFGEGSGTWDFVRKIRTRLHVCDYDLDCRKLRHEFPQGHEVYVDTASDYSSSGSLVALDFDLTRVGGAESTYTYTYLRSDDGGRRFTKWAWAESMRKPAQAVGGDASVIWSTREGSKRDMAALVVSWCDRQRKASRCDSPARPPGYQFMISHDNGRTWKRAAAYRDADQTSSLPRPPWTTWGPVESVAGFQLGPGGRLLLQARTYDWGPLGLGLTWDRVPKTSVLYCSLDSGRTWSSPCRA